MSFGYTNQASLNILMNLHELQITKDVKEPHVDWKTVFEKHGWKVLGEGIEATVGTKPGKPYVLKVFPAGSSFKYFVDFCEKNPSPHLPTFSRKIRPVPGATPPAHYVRMEPLQFIGQGDLMAKYFPWLAYAWIACDRNNIEMHWIWHNRIQHMIEEKFGQSAHSLKDNYKSRALLWSKIGTVPASWKQLVDKLIAYVLTQTQNSEIDFHPGNFMLRGNTLVIIDAISTM